MANLLGFYRSDFTTKDGGQVTGYNCFVSEPAVGPEAKGVKVERIYVSDRRISTLPGGKLPSLGSEVGIAYNKYGKLSHFWLLNAAK